MTSVAPGIALLGNNSITMHHNKDESVNCFTILFRTVIVIAITILVGCSSDDDASSTNGEPSDDIAVATDGADVQADDSLQVAENNTDGTDNTNGTANTDGIDDTGDVGDVNGMTAEVLGNNTARLMGPVIGDGSEQNDRLVKAIDFSGPPDANLALRQVYLTNEIESLFVGIIGIVQNTSQQTYCFGAIDGITVRNSANQALEFQPFSPQIFVEGSVGFAAISPDMYTDACLASGEQGYFTSVFASDEFSEISQLTYDELGVGSENLRYSIAAESVIPVSYSVEESRISVLVANRGSRAVSLDSATLVFLDNSGNPIGFDFITDIDQLLSPGQEFEISDTVFFNGTSTIVEISTSFTVAE